jgi:hypothetical protein
MLVVILVKDQITQLMPVGGNLFGHKQPYQPGQELPEGITPAGE